jgi:hypothetical protein
LPKFPIKKAAILPYCSSKKDCANFIAFQAERTNIFIYSLLHGVLIKFDTAQPPLFSGKIAEKKVSHTF